MLIAELGVNKDFCSGAPFLQEEKVIIIIISVVDYLILV